MVRVLEQDPDNAEAQLTAGFAFLTQDTPKQALAHLRRCVALRSGGWLLETLRALFAARNRLDLNPEGLFLLGAVLRSALPTLAPPLSPEQRRACHDYVNVIGTSYVRSFGGSKAFFPLFIGMGPTMLLLTDEQASITRRKFAANMERLDPRRDTILIIGGDTYYHVVNILKTKPDTNPQPTPEDYKLLDLVCERHRPILRDTKDFIRGRVLLLCCTPAHHPLMNHFSIYLNRKLAQLCKEEGSVFLDWWAELADPKTNRLREEYCANAYPGDVHFSLSTTSIFIDKLKSINIFDESISSSSDYEWSHVFDCTVDRSERTRIWCEPNVTPNNAFQSDKIASSYINGRIADLLTVFGVINPYLSILLFNIRDSHLPTLLPASLQSKITALTDGIDNYCVGLNVLDFYGRSDIQLLEYKENNQNISVDSEYIYCVLIIHPNSLRRDIALANSFLCKTKCYSKLIVVGPSIDAIKEITSGYLEIKTYFNIGNKYIPEKFANTTMAILP